MQLEKKNFRASKKERSHLILRGREKLIELVWGQYLELTWGAL